MTTNNMADMTIESAELNLKSLKEAITNVLPSNSKSRPPTPRKSLPIGAIASPLFIHCAPAPENKYDEVLPNVFLGDSDLAYDKTGLQNLGVTHILNAAQGKKFNQIDTDADYYGDVNIHFMGVRAVDFPNFKMQPHFTTAAQYIADTMDGGGKLYIHCRQGLSRSATLLLAYMMLRRGIPIAEAATTLRKKRPILPNDGFLKQLIEFNQQLFPDRASCDEESATKMGKDSSDTKTSPKPVINQTNCDAENEKRNEDPASGLLELNQDKASCDCKTSVLDQEIHNCDTENKTDNIANVCDDKIHSDVNNSNVICTDDRNVEIPSSLGLAKDPATGLENDTAIGLANDTASGLANDAASGLTNDPATGLANDQASGLPNDPASELANDTATGLVNDTATGLVNDTATGLTNDTASELENGTASKSSCGDSKDTVVHQTGPVTRKQKLKLKLEQQKPPSFTVEEIKQLLRAVKTEGSLESSEGKGKKEHRLLFVNRDLSGVVPCNRYDEVYPGIYLGDHLLTRNMPQLKKLGITHIVNTAQGKKFTQIDTSEAYYADIGAKFFGINAMDIHKFNMKKHFHEAADFMDDALKAGGSLYVHCHQGFSRSAAVTMAFLMIKRQLHLVEAITVVRKRRAVMPNEGFIAQLIELEDTLWP